MASRIRHRLDRPGPKQHTENYLMLQLKEKERQIAELITLKPERDSLLIKLDQAKRNSNKCNRQYEERIILLEKANKKLSLEKEDLEHRFEKLTGQNSFAADEIEKLSETNKKLTKNYNQATENVKLYHKENRELKSQVEEAAVLVKKFDKLTQQKIELTNENEQCKENLERTKRRLKEEWLRGKDLEKSIEEERYANRKLKAEIEENKAEFKLTEDENIQLKSKLEERQNIILNYKHKLSSIKTLKAQLREKENEIIITRKEHGDDITSLKTALKERELSEQGKIAKIALLDSDMWNLRRNLFEASEEISKIKYENNTVKNELQQSISLAETRKSKLELANHNIVALKKELKQCNEQVEKLKKSKELLKIEADKEIGIKENHLITLQDENEQLKKKGNAQKYEIFKLHKEKNLLENSLSKSTLETKENQYEVNSLKRELSSQQQQHKINLNKVIREAQHFRKPKRCFKKRRDSYLWTNAMSEMVQQFKLSGERPVKILHQPCVGLIEKLTKKNKELQQMLNRRPDSVYLQMHWCKKKLQKARETNKVLKADCVLYKNLSQRELNEKTMWKQEASKHAEEKKTWMQKASQWEKEKDILMQKFQELQWRVQNSATKVTPKMETSTVINCNTMVINMHGQPTKVTVVDLPSNNLPNSLTPKYKTKLRLPPISNKGTRSAIPSKIGPLPAIGAHKY